MASRIFIKSILIHNSQLFEEYKINNCCFERLFAQYLPMKYEEDECCLFPNNECRSVGSGNVKRNGIVTLFQMNDVVY